MPTDLDYLDEPALCCAESWSGSGMKNVCRCPACAAERGESTSSRLAYAEWLLAQLPDVEANVAALSLLPQPWSEQTRPDLIAKGFKRSIERVVVKQLDLQGTAITRVLEEPSTMSLRDVVALAKTEETA